MIVEPSHLPKFPDFQSLKSPQFKSTFPLALAVAQVDAREDAVVETVDASIAA